MLSGASYFHSIIFLIVSLTPIHSKAQIENITINQEVNIDKFYAGLFSNSNLDINGNNYITTSSAQFGTRISVVLIPERIRIRSFGVFKITENDTQIFRSYEAIVTPHKKVAIHFGLMATPTTLLRPNPTTWQSQIETNAEKTIIGGRPGIKMKHGFNADFALSYGIHNHDNYVGQHLKIEFKRFIFSIFIERQTLFSAIKWKFNEGNLLITYSKNTISLSNVIPMSSDYKIYVDFEYNTSAKKHTFFDISLRRFFLKDTIKGFLSIGYNDQSKSIQGGLFIHI